MAWLPHSIAEASTQTPVSGDVDVAEAWSHVMHRLDEAALIVESTAATGNRIDRAAGLRHLLVLLATGVDEALRFDPDPILCVERASTDDILTWGMECPDCHLHCAPRCAATRVIAFSATADTARYVGLQTMDGIVCHRERS